MASVGIIGAGIAGLTAAYRLRQQGLAVTVLEAASHVGGKMRSERRAGYLIEHGPNTIQRATPLLSTLIGELDLRAAVVEAAPAAKTRYVVRDGTPHPLPTSPPALLTASLFSWPAKLRLLAEPFIGPAPADAEESVADFARRRLGHEMLTYGLDPFVGGIFAGDPEQLSLPHAFGRLHALEQEHGSLLKGMLRRARGSAAEKMPEPPAAAPKRMFSFRDGLQTLPEALAAPLLAADTLHLNTRVTALHRADTQWAVTTTDASGSPCTRRFDAVISTMPLPAFAALDVDVDVDLSPFAAVDYPPVSVLATGFRRGDVVHPLDGFGLLVPAAETSFEILGTLFSSTLFPHRAPDDHVLLTTFVGGARHPALGRVDDDTLQTLVRRDLKALLGVRGAPVFVRRISWPAAIPQYTLGYGRIKALIDRLEAAHPRLFLAGNYRNGIAVGDAMGSGDNAARHVVKALDAG